MSQETFTFKVASSDPAVPLTLSVWVNDQRCFGPQVITEETVISHEINDEEEGQDYCFKFEMSGKKDEHTKIDEQGNILKDAVLEFKDFEIMGIDINNIVPEKARYTHDLNGHSESTAVQFFNCMGCNGTVELTLTTPIYMWLLENL